MGRFDLGALLQQQQSATTEERNIETITQEILDAQRAGGQAIITIGNGLIEAKAKLEHGEWLPWLAEKIGYSERTAQGFMRLARKYSNPQLVADLGVRKALALLALPESERDGFMSETHQVDGEGKNVIDMTSRELERAIREREEALAEKRQAEQSRQKMEEDMKAANARLAAAQAESDAAAKREMDLRQELEELKARPIEVTGASVPDETALEAARAEGAAAAKAETEAALKEQLDKAKAAKKKSDEKREQAEAAVETLKLQLAEAAKAQKQAAIASDSDAAKFEVYFNQVKETVNKMQGLLIKVRNREDQTAAEKMTKAILALSDAVKGAAE